ncbi:MAG: hypothetical protein L7U83_06455, partial [Akkermansiaceae bacterium]|nr:hypothetical protein [Akkermansiaceae bacterium]
LAANSDPCVSVVVNNAVLHRRRHVRHLNRRFRIFEANRSLLVGQMLASGFVVLVERRLIKLPRVSDSQTIQSRSLRHLDPRHLSCRVDDRCLGALQAKLSFCVIARAPQRDARFELDALLVDAGLDQDGIAGFGRIDASLNGLVGPWHGNRSGGEPGRSQVYD